MNEIYFCKVPILVEGTEDLIIRSLKEKWQHARKDEFPDVIPLYYQKQTAMPVWPASENRQFFQLEKKVSHHKHFDYQSELINKYWHNWLEPIVAEHEAARLWCSLVDQSINQALDEYQRDYLNLAISHGNQLLQTYFTDGFFTIGGKSSSDYASIDSSLPLALLHVAAAAGDEAVDLPVFYPNSTSFDPKVIIARRKRTR